MSSPFAPGLAAAAAVPHPQTPDAPVQRQLSPSQSATRLWPWLVQGLQDILTRFGQVEGGFGPERGVDLYLPVETPITALAAGIVRGAGYYGGGGIVSVGCHVSGMGGMQSVYYQHLDLIAPGIGKGSVVVPGQVIGYSGGQLHGGHHPASPRFSGGPHVEIGINGPWGGMWAPLGPNVDPLPWLESLVQNGGPSGPASIPLSALANQSAGHIPGFAGIAQQLDASVQFQGFQILNPVGSVVSGLHAFLIRATIVVIGLALVLLFAANVMRSVAASAGPEIQGAANIAALAALA